MDFMTLAATVCRELNSTRPQTSNKIITIKNSNNRDVVTALDLRLHSAVEDFVHRNDPSAILLSEEDNHLDPNHYWKSRNLVVLDPLDGSNNYALGIPGYGLMAAHLVDQNVAASLVVLPERDLYLVWQGDRLITSQPVPFARSAPSATTYFAYPPTLGGNSAEARRQMIQVIDELSAGLYRSGSACIGLFQLLMGAHRAFVGLKVRVWDVFAYLPILADLGLETRYVINGLTATLITGHDKEIVGELEDVCNRLQPEALVSFTRNQPLVIGEQ